MACEWTYDALKEIRTEIKELFGVEPWTNELRIFKNNAGTIKPGIWM
jgi:hypothetical protein